MMLSFLHTDTSSSSSALLAVLGHRDAGDGSGEYERRLEVLRVDLSSSKGVLGRDLSPLLPPGRFLVFHNSWFTFRREFLPQFFFFNGRHQSRTL